MEVGRSASECGLKLILFSLLLVAVDSCWAVASNRPTETLASVISFAFVVYSHHKHCKYLGRELAIGSITVWIVILPDVSELKQIL